MNYLHPRYSIRPERFFCNQPAPQMVSSKHTNSTSIIRFERNPYIISGALIVKKTCFSLFLLLLLLLAAVPPFLNIFFYQSRYSVIKREMIHSGRHRSSAAVCRVSSTTTFSFAYTQYVCRTHPPSVNHITLSTPQRVHALNKLLKTMASLTQLCMLKFSR